MPSTPAVTIKPFSQLTLLQLHACLKLRGQVFVVGQQICAVADVDEYDPRCQHVMLWLGDELAGTARLLAADDDRSIKVGRVAVAQVHRGRGLGTAMMRQIQSWIGAVPGRIGVMSAQAHLEDWYATLGWRREGGVYVEAGIDHVKMLYTPREGASDGPN